jgi:hypothetical protein
MPVEFWAGDGCELLAGVGPSGIDWGVREVPRRHREERSDAAIQGPKGALRLLDRFAHARDDAFCQPIDRRNSPSIS